MAEPFSIATAAVGLADVAFRFGKYVQELRKKAKGIDEELEALNFKVKSCEQIGRAIKANYNETKTPSDVEKAAWADLGWMLSHTENLLCKLDGMVKNICNPASHTFSKHLDVWLQVRKILAKDDDLKCCQRELGIYLGGMEIILQRIDQQDARQAHRQTATSLMGIQNQVGALQNQVADLRQLMISKDNREYKDSDLSALDQLLLSIEPVTKRNVHFSTPQSVSSVFTGRDELLRELSSVFIQPPGPLSHQYQRRFVIHGIAGSGKTQFCCKFADMNRYKFWGVFCVDGSSEASIKEGFGAIARIPGRSPNIKAAMDWLSTVEERWLLLMDNADDGSIRLEDYFPQGRGGHILITTRSPKFKVHGNTGPRHYDFSGLPTQEASELLLRASGLPAPWESSWAGLACTITKALGYLVLAIIHAGAAIRDHLCELDTYLEYFNHQWETLRNHATMNAGTKDEGAVFVTFELCYGLLDNRSDHVAAADAKDVLHIFAFLRREGLSLEILDRAMSNVTLEAAQEEEDRRKSSVEGSTTSEKVGSALVSIFARILGKNVEPPLPSLIRDGRREGGSQESRDRVRRALRELTQLSLLSYNDNDQTYAMHPLVHKWARERVWDEKRPKGTLASQALWAELAGQVLAASILMPPLVKTSRVETHHFKLYPHVQHVQECRALITRKMEQVRRPFWRKWLATGNSMNAGRIRMLAKFCVVYTQCGHLKEAQLLLEQVVHFLHQNLGMQHKQTRLATTALSGIYWELGQPEKALQLQHGVVDACQRHLGFHHGDTFAAWNTLGTILWQQGKFTEAAEWQKKAVAGLRALREGSDSSSLKAATLEAIDDLGRTIAKFWRYDDLVAAREMHAEAVAGMKEMQHPRTTFAMESLARVSALLGEALPQALDLTEEVIAFRKARNGKEAPWTLLAEASKCIVLGALGRFQDSESLMRSIMAIAVRNIGEDHIGVLFGRQVLATMISHQGRYSEAERILVDVSERQKRMSSRRGDYHPDRIVSLVELARCHQLQGKYRESIERCNEAIEGLDNISKTTHPFKEMLTVARTQMAELMNKGDLAHLHTVTVIFPEPCFKSPSSVSFNHAQQDYDAQD